MLLLLVVSILLLHPPYGKVLAFKTTFLRHRHAVPNWITTTSYSTSRRRTSRWCSHLEQELEHLEHLEHLEDEEGVIVDEDEEELPFLAPYDGPVVSIEEMESGWSLEELGINVMVGPSASGLGKGLFVNLQSEVGETFLPQGTILCGYSKGHFQGNANGDKTVAYQFTDIRIPVVYDKRFMHLYEAIEEISNTTTTITDLSSLVAGHIITFHTLEDGSQEMKITPDNQQNDTLHYFIPFDATTSSNLTILNAGMMANDLAFHMNETKNELEYDSRAEKNVLLLVWRMVFDGQRLQPSWPVVATNTDVLLLNEQPMEVGIHYSWRYWNAMKNKTIAI
eukprot:gene553-594_t